MKIELKDNKVFFENQGLKKEIHPFWLRERVNGDIHVDKKTQQRLFDPTELKKDVKIENLNLSKNFLEITFNDGSYTKLEIQNIIEELRSRDPNIDHGEFELQFKLNNSINYRIKINLDYMVNSKKSLMKKRN